MKWILCGLTFALAVALAVGTAAIRAGNVQLRRDIERDWRRVEARAIELRRLSVMAVEHVTPERLVVLLRSLMTPVATTTPTGQEATAWQ
jgi:hypothetical protein